MITLSKMLGVRFDSGLAKWIKDGAASKGVSTSRVLRAILWEARSRHAGSPLPPYLAPYLTRLGDDAVDIGTRLPPALLDWLRDTGEGNDGASMGSVVRALVYEAYGRWREDPVRFEEKLAARIATLHLIDAMVTTDAGGLIDGSRRGLFEPKEEED